jgi:predicted TIM-barrel fold metal-dependent hydrolase
VARDSSAEQIAAIKARYPDRILGWFSSTDITKPEAEDLLTKAVKAGAIGFGELKSHVAAMGPELRRVYALAAELSVPVLVHFQEVPTRQPKAPSPRASRISKPY